MKLLKHCPFCGSGEYSVEHVTSAGDHFFVMCGNCKTWGPAAPSAHEAESRWQDRPDCVSCRVYRRERLYNYRQRAADALRLFRSPVNFPRLYWLIRDGFLFLLLMIADRGEVSDAEGR